MSSSAGAGNILGYMQTGYMYTHMHINILESFEPLVGQTNSLL